MTPQPGTEGGPKVVAIGGGHGLTATLRAIRTYTETVTAVVTVADDGGSSGRLRRQFGIVPPGDLRKCLVALSEDDSLLAEVFEQRLNDGPASDPGSTYGTTAGHALGNLVLAGLATATGDLQIALDEAARLLGATGRVVPAALEPAVLKAVSDSGLVHGQTAVARTAHIQQVSLVPEDPPASPAAMEAIVTADQVILGPGSLYTSVLAAVVVPGIKEALASTPAKKVYICNLRPQPAETDGYDVADHLAALSAHSIQIDVVVADTTGIALGDTRVPVVQGGLSRANGLAHDPAKLAKVLVDLVG
jgi:uncharacterized cofD-like protein